MPSDLTNNSAQTARLIPIAGGTPYTTAGSLTTADIVDYYRFSTSTSSNLSVSITGLTGNADLKVYRRDTTGALGARLDPTLVPGTAAAVNAGTLSEAFVLNSLPAGEYIIQVEPGAVGVSADYTLNALASIDGKDTTVLWRPDASPANYFFKQSGAAFTESSAVDTVIAGYRIEATGDFNGDKVTDILWREVGGATQAQAIWLMNADNTVKEKSALRYSAADAIVGAGNPWKTPTEIAVIGAKDLNGDGKDDLIWRNTNPDKAYIYFWHMDGVKNLYDRALVVDFLVGQTVIGFGDFNGDGTQDIVYRADNARPLGEPTLIPGTQTAGKDIIGVWLMNDVNPVGLIQIGSIAHTTKLAGIKNINATVGGSTTAVGADNKDDFVWFDPTTGQASTWLMDGAPFDPLRGATTRIKQEANLGGPLPGGFFVAGVADVTGDGNADIIFRSEAATNVSVFALEGAGVKASQVVSTTQSAQWYVAGVADFNNDGAADILWRYRNQQAVDPVYYDAVTVWTMGGGVNGTSLKTQEWVMKTVGIPAPAFTPAGIRHIGPAFTPYLLSSQYVKIDQAIGGSTEAKSFDIGVVDGTANYQDFVLGAGTDYYKFKLVRSTKFDQFRLTAGANSEIIVPGVALEVFQEGLAGLRTPVRTPAVGGTLPPGVYYIRVKNTGTSPLPDTKINYNLNIVGTPIVVNLQTTPLTVTRADNSAGVVRLVTVDPAKTAIENSTAVKVNYTINNTERGDSGAFKVKFYLSSDNKIDSTASTVDFLLKETTVANVAGNGNLLVNEDVLLPPGDNLFWQQDRDYYIGVVIDPANELLETNETDNSNLGLNPATNVVTIGKDVNVVTIENTQTPDALVTALSLSSSTALTRGGNISVTYSAKNEGRRPTSAVANTVKVAFYLYAENSTGTTPAERARFDISRAVKLPQESVITNIPALSSVPTTVPTLTLPDSDDPIWATGTIFYLASFIDPADAIRESNEANNSNVGVGSDILRLGSIA